LVPLKLLGLCGLQAAAVLGNGALEGAFKAGLTVLKASLKELRFLEFGMILL